MALSSNATAAEFRLMVGDVGVPIAQGAVNTFGLLDYDDQAIEGEAGFSTAAGAGSQKRGQVIGRQIVVTVLTSDFPEGALAQDAAIQVDGQDYVIRLPLEHSHMALELTNLYLRKV